MAYIDIDGFSSLVGYVCCKSSYHHWLLGWWVVLQAPLVMVWHVCGVCFVNWSVSLVCCCHARGERELKALWSVFAGQGPERCITSLRKTGGSISLASHCVRGKNISPRFSSLFPLFFSFFLNTSQNRKCVYTATSGPSQSAQYTCDSLPEVMLKCVNREWNHWSSMENSQVWLSWLSYKEVTTAPFPYLYIFEVEYATEVSTPLSLKCQIIQNCITNCPAIV